MKTILTIGAIAAGVFLLFRGKGLSAATLANGSVIYSDNGRAYVPAPRPVSSFELGMMGGTINLSNSGQIIRPASALDQLLGAAL